MKNYSFARKRRQVKFLAKQIRKGLLVSGGQWTNKLKRLSEKMKDILKIAPQVISNRGLRKALGAAAVLFGLGMSTPAAAQNFALPESLPFGLDTINYYAFPAFVDLDADGDLDLFAGQYGEEGAYSVYESNFLFFENTSTASNPVLSAPIANPFGSRVTVDNYISMPTFADLDGDGDQDLMGGANYGEFYYYENIGTASNPAFDNPQVNPFGLDSVSSYSFPELVDLDGDGDYDLLAGEILYNELTEVRYGNFVFFQNIGTPNAPSFATPVTNPFGLSATLNFNIPSAGDVDGDGDLDVVVGEYYGNIKYFENTGSVTGPQFATPLMNPFGIVVDTAENVFIPELADIDLDGDIDLFAFEGYGIGKFFENTAKNPVSVKELAPAFKLEVFPNPVQNELVIRTEEEIDQVEVIDLLGRTLDILQPAGNAIALGHLHSGIYTLRVRDKKGNFVVRKIQKL